MPKRNRKKFTPQEFEKIGASNLSAVIYASMMQSNAFLDLSANAIKLYLYMKLQFYGQVQKPGDKPDQFVFNRSMYVTTYGIFSNGAQFTQYCHELIKHGFIELIECGATTRSNNIYKFSDKWQTWGPGTDFRTVAMQNQDNATKKRHTEKAQNKC